MVSQNKKDGWVPPVAVEQRKKPLVFTALSDIEVEEVQWLWYPYIPAGKLTMLEGDPGQGKSWITCALAADISTGRALPGQATALPPQRVLMLSAEDGLGDTVKPRIQKLGGNMENILVSDAFFTLDPEGTKLLEEMMISAAATIVFMDPIVAYMGGKVDMHRANEVRGLMTELANAAKRTGCAIVTVRHLRKAAGGKAIYSGIGSIDFTAAVRSVLQVQESEGGTKYLYHAKHNLTPKGPSLAYGIDGDTFSWKGILREEPKEVSKKSHLVSKAESFLRDILQNGPVLAAEVSEKGALIGISSQALQRAKSHADVISKKTAEGWVWYLEGRAEQAPSIKINQPDPEIEALVADARARLAQHSGV